MGRQEFRVASWNLKWNGRASEQFVADRRLDLLALQEVTPEAFERFRALFADGVHSIAHDLCDADPAPKHGVALLWSERLAGRGARLLNHMVLPHRFLVCDLAFVEQRGYFAACSYHALNGEQGEDGFDKPRFTYQVARWPEDQPTPIVIGMDANSPAVDHPDITKIECHFDWLGPRHFERALLGPEARHRLVDTWRVWLDTHPDELARVVAERENGPLAVSHRTGKTETRPGNPQRFDHILATQGDFWVVDASYDYAGALAAGSDHALVTATLVVQLTSGGRSRADKIRVTRLD
jgi:endonuclease/exonuclease/phosphatase family metal-dependent hydrolase